MTNSFQLGRMNHVGIAVPNIKAAIEHYKKTFNATDITEIGDLPEQGVKVAFVNLPSGQIELIEPLGEKSPIHRFLKRNPIGGQHHVCFEVENIYEALEQVASKGIRVLNKPRIGAHGTLIIFLHPKDMGGTLIELMERPK